MPLFQRFNLANFLTAHIQSYYGVFITQTALTLDGWNSFSNSSKTTATFTTRYSSTLLSKKHTLIFICKSVIKQKRQHTEQTNKAYLEATRHGLAILRERHLRKHGG